MQNLVISAGSKPGSQSSHLLVSLCQNQRNHLQAIIPLRSSTGQPSLYEINTHDKCVLCALACPVCRPKRTADRCGKNRDKRVCLVCFLSFARSDVINLPQTFCSRLILHTGLCLSRCPQPHNPRLSGRAAVMDMGRWLPLIPNLPVAHEKYICVSRRFRCA